MRRSTIHHNSTLSSQISEIAETVMRRGLTAKAVLLPGEDGEIFQQFANSLLNVYQPACDDEFLLVEEMIICKWKMRRAWGFESTLIRVQILESEAAINARFEGAGPDVHAALAFKTLADNSKALQHLQRIESRLSRAYDRALEQLVALQATRRENDVKNTPESATGPAPDNANKNNVVSIEKPILQNEPKVPTAPIPAGIHDQG